MLTWCEGPTGQVKQTLFHFSQLFLLGCVSLGEVCAQTSVIMKPTVLVPWTYSESFLLMLSMSVLFNLISAARH